MRKTRYNFEGKEEGIIYGLITHVPDYKLLFMLHENEGISLTKRYASLPDEADEQIEYYYVDSPEEEQENILLIRNQYQNSPLVKQTDLFQFFIFFDPHLSPRQVERWIERFRRQHEVIMVTPVNEDKTRKKIMEIKSLITTEL